MIFVFTPDFSWADRLMYEEGYDRREWRFVRDVRDVRGYSGLGHSVMLSGHELSESQLDALLHLQGKGIS